MAVYPNNRYASASPYRQIGGEPAGLDALQSATTARRNRFTNAAWSGIAGGDSPSGLLPLVPGALAAYHHSSTLLNVAPATLSAGVLVQGVAAAELSVEAAPLQLRALCSGTASVNLAVATAPIAQLVPVSGGAVAALGIAAPLLCATAALEIQPCVAALGATAQLSGTGRLSGSISPYTPLSPESLAAKVEDTLGPRLDDIKQKVGITLALAAAG